MARLLPLIAFLSVAVLPAASQTQAQHAATTEPAPAPAIDPALVGQWELAEVESADALGMQDATVEKLACRFGADGEATVEMVVEQDGEQFSRSRSFRFSAADGQVLVDGVVLGVYEALDGGEIRLALPDGFVARLRRADA